LRIANCELRIEKTRINFPDAVMKTPCVSEMEVDTLHILVVDDEFGMRQGAERVLREFALELPDINGEVRFAVKTAATGKELEEKLAAGQTDILLLDHKLPDITGLDILDRLGRRSLDCLTIMITAYADIDLACAATFQSILSEAPSLRISLCRAYLAPLSNQLMVPVNPALAPLKVITAVELPGLRFSGPVPVMTLATV